MDCNCNCFGMASAARVPVKRYNLLVPDVFPVTEPPFARPLGITIERKIKKLAEYLEKNEHRAPKVSRRLQRRLYSDLAARRYGYVKLAVQTYSQLLLGSKPEKSNLLANELVVRTVVKRRRLPFGGKYYLSYKEPQLGSVVGLLLTQPSPAIRKLGVDLLIDFLKQQHTSDYVSQLEAFVPLLCHNASPHVTVAPLAGSSGASPAKGPTRSSSSRSSMGLSSRAAAAGAAGAAGAGGESEEDQWAALRAASLRALLEHLRFCARLSYVSYHLHTITFAVLGCVEASGQGLSQGQYMSPREALQAGINPLESMSRFSISRAIGASPPDIAALLVFEELAHMTRDAAEGKKVLEFVMRFLDGQGRWLGSPVLRTSMAVLQQACEAEHQRYLLFSTLLRHVAAAEQLTPAERAAVLQLAVDESRQLEAGLAAPALLLALRELPAVIASGCGSSGEVPPMPADRSGNAAAFSMAQPAAAAAANGKAKAAAGATAAGPGGRQEIELPKLAINRVQGAAGGAAGAPGCAADLQPAVLAAVGQLAARVEDSSPLMEAISSTVLKLRGAAPISTAALQCCVAAGQAMQHASPKTSRGAGTTQRTFPSLLLQQLAGIMASWGPQQRLLAHQLLLQLLPAAVDGLREQQAAVLLSALWHEAAFESNHPAAFVAMDRTLQAMLAAAPAAALPQAVKMVAALQAEVLQAGSSGSDSAPNGPAAVAAAAAVPADASRLATLSAAQCCALLCVCSAVLQAFAAQLGQPGLQELAVPGCASPMARLAVHPPPRGLVLSEQASSDGAAMQQQFWQGAAVALAFSPEEQQRAAAFLAGWRQSTSVGQQQAALAAALAAMPLAKQQQQQAGVGAAAAAAAQFQPMPLSALEARLKGSGAYTNGSVASGEGDSKRAQRLRSVYKHMRQISLSDVDRVALATISQESAAEEPAEGQLRLDALGLGVLDDGDDGAAAGDGEAGGGGSAAAARAKTVDDVLAEVDAALQAAEEAMARGRSPSPVWHAGGGGSSSAGVSAASRNGGGSGAAAAQSVAALQQRKPTLVYA